MLYKEILYKNHMISVFQLFFFFENCCHNQFVAKPSSLNIWLRVIGELLLCFKNNGIIPCYHWHLRILCFWQLSICFLPPLFFFVSFFCSDKQPSFLMVFYATKTVTNTKVRQMLMKKNCFFFFKCSVEN